MSRVLAPVLLAITLMVATDALPNTAERPAINATITFFYYKDLETAASFYRDLVGLNATTDTDWVKIFEVTPGSSIGLVQEGKGFLKAAADKPAMLSLVTDDVDAWYQRIIDADVPVLRELPPAGSPADKDRAPIRGFIVEDPGGYAVEFFAWQ
ncbi:MAG: VOC family protein [Woeseiaceae bacterium]|nr:VOC family protein [Woeseiaceae bacterium]